MKKLSITIVNGLSPKDSRYEVMDSEVKGFGVRINPSGKKSFFVRGLFEGNNYRITLPEESFDDARVEAIKILAEAEAGRDPREHIRAYHSTETVETICNRYIEELIPKLKPSTRNVYSWVIRSVLIKRIGLIPIGYVDSTVCQGLHDALAETPRQANMALSILSKILKTAADWGHIVMDENPVKSIKKNVQAQRVRILNKKELDDLMDTINGMLSAGSANFYVLTGLKLIVMTGQRKDLIRTLRWGQVDFATGFIHFPQGRGKKDRLFPISPAVRTILENMPSRHQKFVLPASRKAGAISTFDDVWKTVKVVAKLEDVHINDLRHTFANHLLNHDVAIQYVGELLGATSPQALRRYKHLEKLRSSIIDIS